MLKLFLSFHAQFQNSFFHSKLIFVDFTSGSAQCLVSFAPTTTKPFLHLINNDEIM